MATGLKGTEHYVSRPDGRAYYYKIGKGEPLVFMHSAGASGWAWRKLLDKFAQHFTCYNVDLPGYDHSDIPPRRYYIEDFGKAVLDIMDSAKIRQASFVGDHTGAHIAVCLAAEHPDRVSKLVLDGLPYWTKEVGKLIWERFFIPSFSDKTSFELPVVPMTIWDEAKARNPNLERDDWEKGEEIKRRSRLWMRFSEEANTLFSAEEAGPRVKAPTLLLYGEHDPLRRGELKASQGIKGSILKVVSGGAGTAHSGNSEEFTKHALDFLLGRS